jgi:hypothetical protein
MCEMCEGRTMDEVLDRLDGLVRTHGWALQGVQGSGAVSWLYTIGLTTGYGHPELLTIDTDVGRAARLLNGLGAAIRDGTVLGSGVATTPDGAPIDLVAVHPVHLRGDLVAMWHRLHARSVGRPPPLEVLQVLDPEVLRTGRRSVRERLDRAFARTP